MKRTVLRALLDPRVIVSVLLAGALLFVAFSLGNLGAVLGRVKTVPLTTWVIALGCAAAYLLLKATQLHLLLHKLGVHPGWQRFALAFALGELVLTFPLGIFAQNWVFSEDEHIQFGHSAAATVTMLLSEIAIVLLWLAIFGIPGWPPLQPLAALALALIVALLFGGLLFEAQARRLARKVKHDKLQRMAMQGIGLVRGLKSLGNVRLLAVNLLVTTAYLGALILAFQAMGRGVGLDQLSYLEASTIYAFALAAILLGAGLFGQVGTLEVIGMSAAHAYGLGYTDGLALMLGFRLAWTAAVWLLSGPVTMLFWHKYRPHAKHEHVQAPRA